MPIETHGRNPTQLENNFPNVDIYRGRLEWAINHSEELTGTDLDVQKAREKRSTSQVL